MRPERKMRVVRGPDWPHGNFDGGMGHLGTIVDVCHEDNSCDVRWDIGAVTKGCRANEQEQDLRIVFSPDTDSEYNVHRSTTCDGCKKSGYQGFRWKCVECTDFDLCNECYMNNAHEVSHHFIRFNVCISTVIPFPPRKTSKRQKTYSIMPKAKVRLLKPSIPGTKEVGTVTEVINESPMVTNVKVTWEAGETTSHLLGPDNKPEITVAQPTSHIYPDHLPLADLSQTPETFINVGDRVMVDMNVDTIRQVQKEFGGWNDAMEKILGEVGVVINIDGNSCQIKYTTNSWHFYTNLCSKVSVIERGDMVKLLSDIDVVKRRQHRHGGWKDNMRKSLGEVGQVTNIDHIAGDLFVKFGEVTHLLNPSCCVKVCDAQLPAIIQTEETQTGRSEDTCDNDDNRSIVSASDSDIPDSKGISDEFLLDMDFDEMVSDIGLRVVRGKDWKWGNQDGGEGNVGTVLMVGDGSDDDSCPLQCTVVQWDSGYRNTYRAGFEDSCDLKIYDTASVGIKHSGLTCSECHETDLVGFVWMCETCSDVVLCHTCYHGDEHVASHQFLRMDKPGEDGIRVAKRQTSRQIKVKGMFEGAIVKRGPDWRWETQDDNKEGTVIAVVNFSLDTDRDAVEVEWKSGYTNVYRYGYDGSLDVKCIKGAECGKYFRDHLPDFKIKMSSAGSPLTNGTVEANGAPSDRLMTGDTVRIGVDPDVLQAIHKSEGDWSDSMMDCIGSIGEVVLTENENITVKFENGSWTFKEMALVKVKNFKTGDIVRVRDNEAEVRDLQNGHGDWNAKIQKVLGKKGRVSRVDQYDDVIVRFGRVEFKFNPECLDLSDGPPDDIPEITDPPSQSGSRGSTTRVKDKGSSSSAATMGESRATGGSRVEGGGDSRSVGASDLVKQFEGAMETGDAVTIKEILEQDKSLLNAGQPPYIHTACKKGHLNVVKVFISEAADLEIENDTNSKSSPLLTAVRSKKINVVEALLRAGVSKDTCNSNGQTAVHIAVQNKDIDMLNVLESEGFDVNQKDKLRDGPITDAITTGDTRIITKILNWRHIDLNFLNMLGFSPFHVAARKGDLNTVKLIFEKCPDLLNKPKSDGFTALHLAACQNHKDVVEWLISVPGVETGLKTIQGWTALHVACKYQSRDTVKLLLGLDKQDGRSVVAVNALDSEGNNALHICLREDDVTVGVAQKQSSAGESNQIRLEITKMLLKREIQHDATNKRGKTPLDECDKELQAMIRTLTPRDCKSCNEEIATFQLLPCKCIICNDCGGKKAKKCPNCANDVISRNDISSS